MPIKKLGKAFLGRILETQVQQLRRKNEFKVIAVVGSVGKTSTKLAIAKLFESSTRTLYQTGNYNDRLTVPLVFFGQLEPGIFDILAWLKILVANHRALRRSYSYDVVVVELGIDAPAQMQHFAYLQPDILVITAITAEHMVYFKTMETVVQEELLAASFSNQVLINIDDSPVEYLANVGYKSYGLAQGDYHVTKRQVDGLNGQGLTLQLAGKSVSVKTALLGDQGAKTVLAAAATADLFGLSSESIAAAVPAITAVAGRMQVLSGVQDSTIIDDSYNASPVAVKTALDVLYAASALQRIAVLGSMNEMGSLSPEMHRDVGAYCDPAKVDLVITLGTDANAYLAPAAQERGCNVITATSPYEAADIVKEQLKVGAVILVKGSQNGVFSEETVKLLLADQTDAAKLVRQSPYWMKRKSAQFKH